MDINKFKDISYDDLRNLYRKYLLSLDIAKNTIETTYVDTFYLWRNGNKELFWDTVTDINIEGKAKKTLKKALSENSKGNVNSLVNGYLSHLKKFCSFLDLDITIEDSVPNPKKLHIEVIQKSL